MRAHVSEVAVASIPTTDGDFDAFVAARGPALWRSAWLLTGDHQRAEDLVQTALGKAWPHWQRVSETGSFEAYVRKVLFTTYVAWWRRRWNTETPTATPPEITEGDDADAVALRGDVATALAGLSKGQRAVIVLRYFEDLTEAQTAEVLGCSRGTVKSQASRALAALRSSPALASDERGTS
jgi:RNA polymerase sigma-70 factor (sigma-E family)